MDGTSQAEQAIQYLQSALQKDGYATSLQTFSYYSYDEDDQVDGVNVLAVKPGASPREIVVAAHYDSVDDVDGADDNASGVAVLLSAAARLKDVQTPSTIRFVSFGAEENDLDGPRYFVGHLGSQEKKNVVALLNLDSLIAGDKTYAYGEGGSVSLRDWIGAAAAGRHPDGSQRPPGPGLLRRPAVRLRRFRPVPRRRHPVRLLRGHGPGIRQR